MADHWEASLQLISVQKLTWQLLTDHFATLELWLTGNIGAVLQTGSSKYSAVEVGEKIRYESSYQDYWIKFCSVC